MTEPGSGMLTAGIPGSPCGCSFLNLRYACNTLNACAREGFTTAAAYSLRIRGGLSRLLRGSFQGAIGTSAEVEHHGGGQVAHHL